MKCHRAVVGYQDFWGNYPGAIAHGRCMSTETRQVWTTANKDKDTMRIWGESAPHWNTPIPSSNFSQNTSEGDKNQKTTPWSNWDQSLEVLVWMNHTVYSKASGGPLLVVKLSTGNNTMRSPCTCVGKVEDVLPACEITKCSTHSFTFWLHSPTIATLCLCPLALVLL